MYHQDFDYSKNSSFNDDGVFLRSSLSTSSTASSSSSDDNSTEIYNNYLNSRDVSRTAVAKQKLDPAMRILRLAW